jgi:hypothetical protein
LLLFIRFQSEQSPNPTLQTRPSNSRRNGNQDKDEVSLRSRPVTA